MSKTRSERCLVLHVTECSTGGVPASIAAICDLVTSADHEVLVLPLRPHAGDGADGAVAGRFRLAKYRKWRRDFLARTREIKPDYVHLHSSFAGALGRAVLGRKDATVIYSPHCFAFVREDLSRVVRLAIRLLEAVALARTNVLYAVSDKEARSLRRVCALFGVRVVEGFNVASIAPASCESPVPAGHKRDWLDVVAVGRAGEQKGSDFFAQVAAAVERSAPGEFRFTWVGAGDQESEATLRHKMVNVTGWLGPSGVRDALQRSDIYLHTAAWEAFPVSVMDAAACGLPLVLRRIPSLPSAFYPFSHASVESIAKEILRLRDEEAAGQAREAARLLNATFSTDRLANVLRGVYQGN